MAKSLGTLTLDLVAKVGGFVNGMDKAARESDKWRKKVKKNLDDTGKAIKDFGKVAAAGFAVFSAITIKNTMEQERVTKQLEATLKSTGGSAGYASQELLDMASALQTVTTYGDEAIIPAESLLLTFTKIGRDVFPDALESVLNVATAMGTDLKTAALQVGKALNDPEKGIAALTRSGIQFTKDQQEVIKALSETGRVADAQRIILAELENQFGGSARAARDTLGGAVLGLKNAFGDLFEGSGGNVQNAKQAIEDLTKALSDPKVKQAFAEIVTGVLNVTTAIVQALPELTSFTNWVAESLAAAFNGPAADDMVRTSDAIKDIQEQLKGFDQQTGIAKSFNADRVKALRKELEQLEANYAAAQKAQDEAAQKAYKANLAAQAAAEEQKKAAALAKQAADEAAAKALKDLEDKKLAKKVAEEAAQAAKAAAAASAQAAAAIQTRIDDLKLEALLVGKTSDEITLYKLKIDGANTSQLAAADAALKTVAAYEAQQKAIQEAADTAEYVQGLDRAVKAAQQAVDIQIESIGLSSRQAEELQKLNDVQQEYADKLLDLAAAQGTANALSEEAYQQRKEALQKAQDDEVAIVKDGFRRKADAEANWFNGAKSAFQEYIDQANNTASSFNDAFSNALSSTEDAIVGLVQTGKISFKSLADSIVADLIRIGIQKTILAAIESTAGAAGGGGGGVGFAVALASLFGGGRATGGAVNPGSFYQVGEFDRPELIKQNGKQYMIPGDNGNVVPIKSGNSSQQNNYITVEMSGKNPREARAAGASVARDIARAVNGSGRYT